MGSLIYLMCRADAPKESSMTVRARVFMATWTPRAARHSRSPSHLTRSSERIAHARNERGLRRVHRLGGVPGIGAVARRAAIARAERCDAQPRRRDARAERITGSDGERKEVGAGRASRHRRDDDASVREIDGAARDPMIDRIRERIGGARGAAREPLGDGLVGRGDVSQEREPPRRKLFDDERQRPIAFDPREEARFVDRRRRRALARRRGRVRVLHEDPGVEDPLRIERASQAPHHLDAALDLTGSADGFRSSDAVVMGHGRARGDGRGHAVAPRRVVPRAACGLEVGPALSARRRAGEREVDAAPVRVRVAEVRHDEGVRRERTAHVAIHVAEPRPGRRDLERVDEQARPERG